MKSRYVSINHVRVSMLLKCRAKSATVRENIVKTWSQFPSPIASIFLRSFASQRHLVAFAEASAAVSCLEKSNP
jgi:hypothetical protein